MRSFLFLFLFLHHRSFHNSFLRFFLQEFLKDIFTALDSLVCWCERLLKECVTEQTTTRFCFICVTMFPFSVTHNHHILYAQLGAHKKVCAKIISVNSPSRRVGQKHHLRMCRAIRGSRRWSLADGGRPYYTPGYGLVASVAYRIYPVGNWNGET